MKKLKSIFFIIITIVLILTFIYKKDNSVLKIKNTKLNKSMYALSETDLEKFDGCLFVGDSQTVGMQDVMQSRLPSSCQFSAEIGDSPSDALNRIKSSNVNTNQVKLVCLLIGINNPWQISATEELIDYLLETFPSAPIYVQREFYLGASYNDTYTKAAAANAQLDIYNPAVQKYCEQLNSSGKTNVHYIDPTEGFNVTVNGREYLNEDSYAQADGGHFSKAGIEKWLENLANLISNQGTPSKESSEPTNPSSLSSSQNNEPQNKTMPLTKQNYKNSIYFLDTFGVIASIKDEFGYLFTNEEVLDGISLQNMSKFFSLIPNQSSLPSSESDNSSRQSSSSQKPSSSSRVIDPNTQGEQEKLVWNTLKGLDYSDEAVAGVMGNIYAESTFRADIIESTGEGYGLCQWSYSRKTQLIRYSEHRGTSWKDVNTQIEFLVGEIEREGPAVDYTDNQFSGYSSYRNQWLNATNATDAAIAFCYGFERPGTVREGVRTEWAEKYYESYKGTYDEEYDIFS